MSVNRYVIIVVTAITLLNSLSCSDNKENEIHIKKNELSLYQKMN